MAPGLVLVCLIERMHLHAPPLTHLLEETWLTREGRKRKFIEGFLNLLERMDEVLVVPKNQTFSCYLVTCVDPRRSDATEPY